MRKDGSTFIRRRCGTDSTAGQLLGPLSRILEISGAQEENREMLLEGK